MSNFNMGHSNDVVYKPQHDVCLVYQQQVRLFLSQIPPWADGGILSLACAPFRVLTQVVC